MPQTPFTKHLRKIMARLDEVANTDAAHPHWFDMEIQETISLLCQINSDFGTNETFRAPDPARLIGNLATGVALANRPQPSGVWLLQNYARAILCELRLAVEQIECEPFREG